MSITGIVENDTVKLGIHIPDGTLVRLTILETGPSQWPTDYFERTAGALVKDRLVRPEQGAAPTRETW